MEEGGLNTLLSGYERARRFSKYLLSISQEAGTWQVLGYRSKRERREGTALA